MSPAKELSVYIHVPFCRRRCSYCSFVSYAGREADIPAYISALIQEIRLRHQSEVEVQTIYFGGGTPSLFPAASLKTVFGALSECYKIADSAEVTLEANPGTVSLDYLKELRGLGINRLSLGVQSLDDAELQLLERIHTANEARVSIVTAREAGFDNISLDFIYGIPGRRIGTWRKMLREVVTFGIRHLSLYGLTLEEDTPLYEHVSHGEVPPLNPDAAADEYEMAEKMLASAGYRHYEISNWSLPGYESRHNTAYWERKPYLGLGVAAHSFWANERIANTSDLNEYLSCLANGKLPSQTIEFIDEKAALSEAIFLGLRLDKGVSADDIRRQFGIDLDSRFGSEIAECVSLGLLEREGGIIRLTPRGRLLGNEVFMRFLG